MPIACNPAATRCACASSSAYVSCWLPHTTATRSGVNRARCSSTDDRFRVATVGAILEEGRRMMQDGSTFVDRPASAFLLLSGRASGLSDTPVEVDESGFLDALERVRAKRVALRLREILRETRRAVAVEVG